MEMEMGAIMVTSLNLANNARVSMVVVAASLR